MSPVAWRVKDFADGWVLFHTEEEARAEAKDTGQKVEALYVLGGDEWKEALKPLVAYTVEGLDSRLKKLADDLYADMLYNAQDWLLDNILSNLQSKIDAANRQALLDRKALREVQADRDAAMSIVRIARELVGPNGMVNRGVERGLVVVEKADKSDPHYRLCDALAALECPPTKTVEEGL